MSAREPAPKDESTPDYVGHRDRLRRRLLEAGTDALADYELLEFLLYSAQPRGDTKPVAKALLKRFGTLAGVLGADPSYMGWSRAPAGSPMVRSRPPWPRREPPACGPRAP